MVFPPRDPDAAHRPDGFGCGLCPAKQTFGLPRSAQDDTRGDKRYLTPMTTYNVNIAVVPVFVIGTPPFLTPHPSAFGYHLLPPEKACFLYVMNMGVSPMF